MVDHFRSAHHTTPDTTNERAFASVGRHSTFRLAVSFLSFMRGRLSECVIVTLVEIFETAWHSALSTSTGVLMNTSRIWRSESAGPSRPTTAAATATSPLCTSTSTPTTSTSSESASVFLASTFFSDRRAARKGSVRSPQNSTGTPEQTPTFNPHLAAAADDDEQPDRAPMAKTSRKSAKAAPQRELTVTARHLPSLTAEPSALPHDEESGKGASLRIRRPLRPLTDVYRPLPTPSRTHNYSPSSCAHWASTLHRPSVTATASFAHSLINSMGPSPTT